jgi:AraC-like DNA-binding protein
VLRNNLPVTWPKGGVYACMEESVRVGSEDRLLRVVTEIVSDCLESGRPTRARASRLLAVSTRTLQRRLAERGTCFESIVRQVRMGRALALLEQPALTIDAVASKLGYSNSGAFHRAFRAWTGVTPGTYRSQHYGVHHADDAHHDDGRHDVHDVRDEEHHDASPASDGSSPIT